ncbi:putative cytochrome P450 oxidoreductase [Rosellinia necatrix]|uniref:Putative cytochrome P450 oxidoreductase n=1 Tax=Rosellinia necatrix TaxID=77044 RepID=A0A1W2TS00_ROSNE|nr:putative cytochrome P450 oxidoreductase [Rosellinia necatrix]
MLGLTVVAIAVCVAVAYFVIFPVIQHLTDAKGLKKYPNYSWLSPFTDLNYCYLSAQGFRSRDLYLAHKRTRQPILRIGPNSLSFCDSRAVKDIYGHNTPCTKDIKEDVLAGSHRNLFDVVDKPEHARKRKLLSAAFALKNLERWEHKVANTTERLFKAFDGLCTAPLEGKKLDQAHLTVDFCKWINLWTIEAINSIALSSQMDLLDTGSDEVVAERRDGTRYRARYRFSFEQFVLVAAAFCWEYSLWPWLEWLVGVIPGRWKTRFHNGKPFGDIIYHQAAERLRRYQAGEKLDDFFQSLMEDRGGNPNNLEWGEIVSEVGAIINAGSDTTAMALTQNLHLLIKHPRHLEALRNELDSVLEPEDVVAPYDKVKDLPYLRACIDEGLRLMPPTAAGLPRRTPPQGAQIMGEWIAGNTSVNMTIYASHRDESLFPDPESFKPERWLDPESRSKAQSGFIPFSAGARSCLGRNITYLEQTMVLASLVHRYDFAAPDPDWQLERKEAFNMICGSMPIKIWRR